MPTGTLPQGTNDVYLFFFLHVGELLVALQGVLGAAVPTTLPEVNGGIQVHHDRNEARHTVPLLHESTESVRSEPTVRASREMSNVGGSAQCRKRDVLP